MSRHLGRAFRYRMRIPEKMRGLVIVGGGLVKEDEMNLEARFETQATTRLALGGARYHVPTRMKGPAWGNDNPYPPNHISVPGFTSIVFV
jgi:hypothetical protein